ncbi:flavoprotein [Clostridium sp. CX1]|nr:flavoprotein [Clostridium sp. CX1]
MYGKPKVIAIPYKSFKEKIRLTKRYTKYYFIEDLGGVLYMERRS